MAKSGSKRVQNRKKKFSRNSWRNSAHFDGKFDCFYFWWFFTPNPPKTAKSPNPPLQDNLGETRKTASLARSHLAGTQKPLSQVPSTQKSDWTPSKVSKDNTETLWDPTLGSMEHHGSVKIELCEFCPFSAKFALQNCPNSCGTVLRGPKNRSVGVPAGEKVIKSLLECPKEPHNHYGTLPWGPWGTLDRAKSKILQISP